MFGKKVNIEKESDLLRISLAAKDEVIAAWKDRGDRYATHNTALQKELLSVWALLAKMLEQKADGSDFKQLLEKALGNRK